MGRKTYFAVFGMILKTMARPAGLDPIRGEPTASCDVAEDCRAWPFQRNVGMARPAGLEPAASWFVGQCGCMASLVFRVCSSDGTLQLLLVREEIVHGLFTTRRGQGCGETSGAAFRLPSSDSSANSRCTASATRARRPGDKLPSSRLMMLDATVNRRWVRIVDRT